MKNETLFEPEFLIGEFLSNYLFADVLFSGYRSIAEMKIFYKEFAKIFCIHDREWLETAWSVISSDLFRFADGEGEFNRLVRLTKLYPDHITEDEKYILSYKAYAIKNKAEMLRNNNCASFEETLRVLEQKADGGSTACLSLLGFLEHNGIFVQKSYEKAQKHISAAAAWNSVFAALMLGRYSERASAYSSKLSALMSYRSNDRGVYAYLTQELDLSVDETPDKLTLALNQAFCDGSLSPDQIDRNTLKLIRSVVLSERSKVKAIKNKNGKDDIFSAIPLSVTHNTPLTFDPKSLIALSEKRKSEVERICSNLAMSDLRNTVAYKPLMIVCSDEFILDHYRDKIKKCFVGSPIVDVSIYKDNKCDVSRSNSNIFVSAIEKHGEKNTVILIDNCEQLSENDSAEMANFLSLENLKHYKPALLPFLEMDISGMLPIFFAASVPNAKLARCCDVVLASEMSKEEFREILEASVKKKQQIFEVASVSIDPEASDLLFEYSSETVSFLLHRVMGRARKSTEPIRITLDDVEKVIGDCFTTETNNGFWKN